MKKAQATLGIIIGLLIIILALLIVIVINPGMLGNIIVINSPSPSSNYQPQQNFQSPTAQQPNENTYSPGKYVTGSAVVNPPFYMNAWNAKTNQINIELKNNGGEDYIINEIIITGINPKVNCKTEKISKTIISGSTQTFTASCDNKLSVGDIYRGDIKMYYTKLRDSFELTSTGAIAERVME